MLRNIIVLTVAIFFSSIANAGLKYECNRYVNGEYKGYTYVIADNRSQAESIAFEKFKNDLRKRVDHVKCK